MLCYTTLLDADLRSNTDTSFSVMRAKVGLTALEGDAALQKRVLGRCHAMGLFC